MKQVLVAVSAWRQCLPGARQSRLALHDGPEGIGGAIVALAGDPRRVTLTGQALTMTSAPADRPHWWRARGNRSRLL
jgi:hypothetical protein